MAEPRKPRVIKTRPHTVPAPKLPEEQGGAPAPSAPSAPGVPGDRGAVRSTSSKVSVQPLARPDAPASGAPAKPGKAPGKAPGKPGKAMGKPGKAPGKNHPASGRRGTATAKAAGSAAAAGGDRAPETGAQVLAFPVPVHKRRRRAFVYGLAGTVVVLALLMAFVMFSPALAVKTVVFEGRKLVAEETLQAALVPVLGTPLPQVTEGQVQELLKPVVQVKSSIIEARPPSTLLVRVVERVPVALLKNGDDYLLVDQEGIELGSTKDPASVALPLIDGGKAAIGQETFNAVTAVLANLPHAILGQLAHASAASPDAVELKLVDGRSVIWGDARDMELKAQVLEALLNAPPPTAVAGKPEPAPVQVFDVSAPRHPVTR